MRGEKPDALLLDDIQDPGNVGSMLRSAAKNFADVIVINREINRLYLYNDTKLFRTFSRGYPKPANVISADFWRLGQLRPRGDGGAARCAPRPSARIPRMRPISSSIPASIRRWR